MPAITLNHPTHFTGALDPLDEARRWLHTAVAVPYDARDAVAWLREFQTCVASARRALAARGASLRDNVLFPPRLRALARRQVLAHEEVSRAADQLFASSIAVTAPDLMQMVDLAESAKALEHGLERLREHRSDLLFEATYRDLGGGD